MTLQQLINTGILALGLLVLFGVAEFLYHKCNWKVEHSRKLVHIVTGLTTLLFPSLICDSIIVSILCTSFLIILLYTKKRSLLPSINNIQRSSKGSVLFPIVIAICYMLSDYYGDFNLYYLPVLLLTICDPLAAIVGKKYAKTKYSILGNNKTIIGSLCFFLSAFVISLYLLYNIHTDNIIFSSILIAFSTTLIEGISRKGYDNLNIPLTAIILLTQLI